MNFSAAIETGFRRYVDFNARSFRSEFWYWILFYSIVWFAVLICLGVGGLIAAGGAGYRGFSDLIYLVFIAIFACPSAAAVVRRLHDTNRSGWWGLIAFTVVGAIPLILWLSTRGTIGENPFGADPLDADHPAVKTDEAWVS